MMRSFRASRTAVSRVSRSFASVAESSSSVGGRRAFFAGVGIGAVLGAAIATTVYTPQESDHSEFMHELKQERDDARSFQQAERLRERARAKAAAAAAENQPESPSIRGPTVVDDTGAEVEASPQQEAVIAYLRKHRLNEELQDIVTRLCEEQAEDPFEFLAREFNARAKHPDPAAPTSTPVATPVATATPTATTPVDGTTTAAVSAPSSASAAPSAPAASGTATPLSIVVPPTATPDSDDDEPTDAEFESWKAAIEKGYSAAPNPESGRAHIRNIVADEIEELIENRQNDVLLQIYAPWCGACKMMKPIVDSVAQVVHDVESTPSSVPTDAAAGAASHLSVFVMDGDANVKPGFLTPEENRTLPLVKFYPACGSTRASAEQRARPECQPALFQGRPNVEALLEFVHDQTAAQPNRRAFDANQAHEQAKARESQTRDAVTVALVQRFQADAEEMPALKVHEIAPCGAHLQALMRRFMLSGYTSYVDLAADEAAGLALFTAYRECTEKEEPKLFEFWSQVKKQTEEALDNIEQKKHQREEKKKEEASNKAQATTNATGEPTATENKSA